MHVTMPANRWWHAPPNLEPLTMTIESKLHKVTNTIYTATSASKALGSRRIKASISVPAFPVPKLCVVDVSSRLDVWRVGC